MRTVVRHLVPIVMVALALMAAVTIATPAVSSAECADGERWDPTGKVCRPLGVGPQPLACEPGQWWRQTSLVTVPGPTRHGDPARLTGFAFLGPLSRLGGGPRRRCAV